MKATLLKVVTQKRALIALLVAVIAMSAAFGLDSTSPLQATLMLTAWIGGCYTFCRALFDAYFEHLHDRSQNG